MQLKNMAIFNKFCYCCRLETGGLIVGWLSLIKAISSTIAISFILIQATNEKDNHIVKMNDEYYSLLKYYDGFRLSLINLICATLMIVGILKCKAIFLLPWLIIQLIYTALFLVIISFKLRWIVDGGNPKVAIATIIVLPFFIYVWICVLSLYQHLNDQENSMNKESKSTRYETNICSSTEKDKLPSYYKIENI